MGNKTENLEDSLGPYRLVRRGETVNPADVQFVEGVQLVPERIYGGRRTKLAVVHEQRRPQGNSKPLIIPK